MKIIPRYSTGAYVTSLPNGWRLEIPAGEASDYRFAQLDNYTQVPRRQFPSRPPLTFSLRARVSDISIAGTWGFGLWNDPFGLSLGFGGNPLRLPTLPNAIWFFHASKENWLSFSDKPGNGFLAQVFRSPNVPSGLLALSGIPLSPLLVTQKTRKYLRGIAKYIVREDGTHLNLGVSEWHTYKLEWSTKQSAFWVDGVLELESPISPCPPLGLVIWVDNQFAAFKPEGIIKYGLLNGKAAWLEVADLSVTYQ